VSTLLPVDAVTPRRLVLDPPLTDAEFETPCAANDSVHFERASEGEILMHPPAGGFTSEGNAEAVSQLRLWWKTHRRGRMYDSSAGFFLPDGSMLSPDAAYVRPEKLKGLTKDELTGLEKMERWIENGAALGWLVDPYKQKVYVYETRPRSLCHIGKGRSRQGSHRSFRPRP
jgi:Uma2 family endonuclease